MSTINSTLTQERLKAVFLYDPDTGVFTRLKSTGSRSAIGSSPAPCKRDGYIRISVDNCQYLAQRLAWLHFYGNWPTHQVDHINGNRADNRIANLRDVSNTGNGQNRHLHNKNCSSGLLGVYKHGDRWVSKIKVDRKPIHIGVFSTPEEAHAAYVEAKRTLHATCTI